MKFLKKAWVWILLGAAAVAFFLTRLLKGNSEQKKQDKLRRAAEHVRVELADRRAAEEVEHAKRTGNLADHLRRDGAGKP